MKVIMSCGGTGGHIYPAIAIADKIKEKQPDSDILFIGTKKGMEQRLVPDAGYEIAGIDASGIDRRHILNNIKTARNVIAGGREADKIIKSFRPDIVIGTGGYVTGPVVRRGAKNGARCFIHEQNALPGLANRLLEGCCEKVFISFPEAAKYFRRSAAIVMSGNPIRSGFLEQGACSSLSPLTKTLLICGGSLGAEMINRAALDMISKKPEYNIVFVTGRRYFDNIKTALKELPENVCLIDYENDMPKRMSGASLIVSRSGAITLAEILALNKPSVLIPSPNVTSNHQYCNAKAAADAGAALLLEEADLAKNISALYDKVTELIYDEPRLASMSQHAKELARPDAADIIYKNIFK